MSELFFTYLCQRKVLHFVGFYKLFAPISEFIDLARWVKFNTYFIPRLVLIVLSGTESYRGIKFIPRLERFNLFNEWCWIHSNRSGSKVRVVIDWGKTTSFPGSSPPRAPERNRSKRGSWEQFGAKTVQESETLR